MRNCPQRKRIARSDKRLIFGVILVSLLSISPLSAANIPVNTTNDSGTGSLRQGLSGASTNDTLDFQLNLNGTTLSNGQALTVSNAVNFSDVTAAGITLTDNHAYSLANPLTIDWLGTLSLNGVMADGTAAGSLVKDGTGTLVLSGANTFTKGIKLTGGTIDVTNSTALGTGALTVNSAGAQILILGDGVNLQNAVTLGSALTLNIGTGTTQLSGIISGSGALNLTGTGTLTLSGTNTFSSAISVANNSTIIATNNSAFGTGTVTNTGALTLNLASGLSVNNHFVLGNTLTTNIASGTATMSGVLSGANGLTKTGTGTLILSGINTYTGGTILSEGTLQGSSTALTGDFNTASNTSLIFSQSGSGTYSGNITGSGNLIKTGIGTLIFSGTGGAANSTTINAGELLVTGTLPGSVEVASNTILSGTGHVGSVTNSGTVQPGANSADINFLNVDGNYTQQTGGTTSIKINSTGNVPGTNNDNLTVTGQATLGGLLSVNLIGGGVFNTATQFTMLNAATGVSGQFKLASSTDPDFGVVVSYGANDVKFNLQATTSLITVATTSNQLAVGTTLEDLKTSATGELYALINTLGIQSFDQQRQALNQMSGQMFGNLQTLGLQVGDQFQQRVTSRLVSNGQFLVEQTATQSADQGLRGQSPVYSRNESIQGWMQGYGIGGHLRSDGNGASLNYNQGGAVYGYDWGSDENGCFGFAAGNSYVGFNDGFGGGGQLTAYQFGMYALENTESFYWLATTNYGYNDYATNRDVTVAGYSQTLHGDFSGSQIGANAETGLKLDATFLQIQPLIGLQYLYLCQQGFDETGGSAALTVARSRANSLRANIGVRVAVNSWTGPLGAVWTPYTHARFVADLLDNDRVVSSTFNGTTTGAAFISHGTRIGQTYGVIGEGAQIRLNDQWSLFGGGELLIGDRITAATGSAGAMMLW